MNNFEKNEIIRLQNQGLGYKRIADILGLPVNTVKSYCYRYPNKSRELVHICKQCGIEVKQDPQRKKKLFCSDTCRMKWWNAHSEKIDRKALYRFTCSYCGQEFDSYGKRLRKFCSRDCYARFRTKEDC